MKKCGYIALLGRPNAGKSTLLNALVGHKIAGVSKKPQTTRNRILGVITEGDAQLVFLDTPGLHRTRGTVLNAAMNRVAYQTAGDADLVVYLIDVTRGWHDEDARTLKTVLTASAAPVILLGTKMDALKAFQTRPTLALMNVALEKYFENDPEVAKHRGRLLYPEAIASSAKRPEEVAQLRQVLARHVPEGEWMFASDDLTDLPNSFVCAELIREQVFRQLGQEVPYGTAVTIQSFEEKPELTVIRATILVERQSHKGIVVGRGGARIKELGTQARASLENHLERKVFLELSVRVAEGWTDDQRLVAELAHLADLDATLNDITERPPRE